MTDERPHPPEPRPPHGPHGPRRRRRRRPRRAAPALPPPEHGIRVAQIGATWWGARWVDSLVRFGTQYAARLMRGQNYAHEGRVHDLQVAGGVVRASVTGSRPAPYRVTLKVAPLSGKTWDQAIRAMATKAKFAASLLAGEMPRAIDDAFISARASLFPLRRHELRTRCTCPDDANPCKHIAALHFVLAEAFDRDPFLLFELRGRPKETVLAALRALRAGAADTRASRGHGPAAPKRRGPAGVPAPDVRAEAYDALRASVDDMKFRIGTPGSPGVLLRHLGAPPSWSVALPFVDLVAPVVARAAALAREIALGADATPPEPSRAASPRRTSRRA